jgi:hypothetical protein
VAIAPPSDIVLDVARAADPERYRQAVDELSRLRATAAAAAETAAASGVSASSGPSNAAPTGTSAGSAAPPGRRRLDAFGQFESFILQSFLQSMLPTGATNVYGRGTAGSVWRSMLAEQLGNQLAGSGQIGIARHLSNSVAARQAAEPAGAATAAGTRPPGASAVDLSALSAMPPPSSNRG